MTADDALATILTALGEVAPEIDPQAIDRHTELGAELDLDSMDFLTLVEQVSTATGTDIPEHDYPQLMTLASFADYLSRAAATP